MKLNKPLGLSALSALIISGARSYFNGKKSGVVLYFAENGVESEFGLIKNEVVLRVYIEVPQNQRLQVATDGEKLIIASSLLGESGMVGSVVLQYATTFATPSVKYLSKMAYKFLGQNSPISHHMCLASRI